MIGSRAKGNRGELEVAKMLSEILGQEIRRTPNSGAFMFAQADLWGDSDLPYHFEVKRRRNLSFDDVIRPHSQIWTWWNETKKRCRSDRIPVLLFRRDRGVWWMMRPMTTVVGLTTPRVHCDDIVIVPLPPGWFPEIVKKEEP